MIPKRTAPVRISHMGLSDSEELVIDPADCSLPESPKQQLSSEVPGSRADLLPPSTHHPHIIDQDSEDFTMKLDLLVTQFRNESIREFLTMKRSILHEQITTIESERKRCNAQLALKQDELEHTKEQLAQTASTMSAYDSHRLSLSSLLGSYKRTNLNLRCKAVTFSAWLKHHLACRYKRRQGRMVSLLGAKCIARRVFGSWKDHWVEYHSEKQREKLDFLLQEERKALNVQYAKEIQMLQERLQAATKELEHEARNKVAVQENLKKAFMRGVCALNFEAMNILQPGQSSDAPLDMFPGAEAIIDTALQEASEKPTVSFAEEEALEEVQNIPPAESKEDKWKPAPVYGVRPLTAPPVKEAYPMHPSESEPESIVDSEVTASTLPSNLNKPIGQGKTIVVGRNLESEVKIKAKAPVALKTKKAGSKK